MIRPNIQKWLQLLFCTELNTLKRTQFQNCLDVNTMYWFVGTFNICLSQSQKQTGRQTVLIVAVSFLEQQSKIKKISTLPESVNTCEKGRETDLTRRTISCCPIVIPIACRVVCCWWWCALHRGFPWYAHTPMTHAHCPGSSLSECMHSYRRR